MYVIQDDMCGWKKDEDNVFVQKVIKLKHVRIIITKFNNVKFCTKNNLK